MNSNIFKIPFDLLEAKNLLFEVVKRIRLGWHADQESFRITYRLILKTR